MKVDLFTFLFQIANFLILIFLLYYFLFRKIIVVMDKREKMIQSKIDEANENNKKAKEEKENLLKKQEELQLSKNKIFEQTTSEAKQMKDDFFNKAKAEIEESKKRWKEEVEKEKKSFFQDLSMQIPKRVFDLTSKVIQDLSNESIQMVIIEHFLESLKKENNFKSNKNVIIESALEFNEDVKKKILDKLKSSINNEIAVKYKTNPDLIFGINFQINSKIIRWNLNSYLDHFYKDIDDFLKKIEL